MKYITIKLPLEKAYHWGLLSCACGHAINNHFDFNEERPCAHCECEKYREVVKVGKIIKRKRGKSGK